MTLTEHQRAAIEATGNVLVLAGAGSGKTSTLVERCLHHMLHPRQPVSIDEMLIVTFTDAAAAELRKRVSDRLQLALSHAQPADAARLERELALLESAHISTLHGFCLRLVRDHFHEAGLDPVLTVCRPEQAALFMQAALDRVMERHFEAATKDAERVQELIEAYEPGDEEKIRALVLKLHKYTQSLADPARWFSRQIASLQEETPRLWQQWLADALVDWCDRWAPTLARLTQNKLASRFCAQVKAARTAERAEFAALLDEVAQSIDPLPRGFASHRNAIEEFFEEGAFLRSLLGNGNDPLAEDWAWVRGQMETLLRLTQEFSTEYARLKRENAYVDFDDQQQFALDVLLGKERSGPTRIAEECRRKFKLIFVDEYQDINAAQDGILRAVAREGDAANRFLVGDVKQSIYRFRLADPAIFQNYNSLWRETSADGKVIPLSDNFRSRASILDFVNALFADVMRKEVGGVEYDSDARLRPAENDRAEIATPTVELHLRLTEKKQEADEDENATQTELDARMVARRLRELHDSGHAIWDSGQKTMRAAAWSDMVVLLRSPGTKAEIYLREFARAGIPLQAERGGLYDSVEVSDLLSLLQLLDNPRQDVPLLAVLRSPLVGLSLDELACIRAGQSGLFWTALNHWHRMRRREEEDTWKKVDTFLERFARWRRMARHSGLSERVESVLNETHYLEWLLTQSRPAQRQANVRRFVAMAAQFDPVQRQGLQRFLRFVEAQREAEADSEPASVENVNAVRLISIHKSKGLEFPVVAVAGLGTPFNFRDLSESILLDEHYGLCGRVKPPGYGGSYPSLPWWLARRRQRRETMGEELRLLYVALTRARDTLLLFGSANRKSAENNWPEAEMDARKIEGASNALAWIGPWCAQHAGGNICGASEGVATLFRWRVHEQGDLASTPETAEPKEGTRAEPDPEKLSELARRLEWNYPWSAETRESAKLSVTALREATEDADLRFRGRPTFNPRRDPARLTAAEIGTAHHLFLQAIELRGAGNVDALRAQAAAFVKQQVLSAEQARALDLPAIASFWNSPAGREIQAAATSVHREIPFSGRFTRDDLAAAGVSSRLPDGEFVVVQGTIDLAVILPDELWILDFKTDALNESKLPGAIENYAPQLRLYASALSRIYQRPASKRWLHFLSLGKTVAI